MNTLEDIKNRLAAATPGPWFLDAGGDTGVYTEARMSETSSDVASAFHREDEVFIAHAPEDIARLVKALEAVTELANAAQPLTIWGGGTAPGIVSAGDILTAITEALDS